MANNVLKLASKSPNPPTPRSVTTPQQRMDTQKQNSQTPNFFTKMFTKIKSMYEQYKMYILAAGGLAVAYWVYTKYFNKPRSTRR